jgi:hypothetical protein
MSSMCARNGQGSPHTRAPLLFIYPHSKPTVVSKRHMFCAHADGPRPRAGWSAVHITAIFPFEICQSCQKSKVQTVRPPRSDRPRPGNLEHQSSDQVELTHADCPPTRPDSPRPGSQYCPGLSSGQSVVQIPKTTQSLPKPNLAPADGPPIKAGRSAL